MPIQSLLWKTPYLHHSSTIVGDGLLAIAVNKQEVTTVWAQSALDCRLHGNTCVDVGDNLTLALGSVGACTSKATMISLIQGIPPNCPTGGIEAHGPSFSTTIVGVWPLKAMV
jgi:hypothetical protein